ncbi:hypothetical protein NC797_07155 [Aquibacillus sp. 3ASR75-11]|uniref:Uncharacterized protein n=1 Tax=Terrihalobacillus insolitus TaxID=2950438 RepID=A0A9X4AN88_9BACI|nr:hypothetical protein [Terrihalobacillus insolitus]MDC3424285.1 hypothetical protein [Terrihalobacillus insolitus]
MNNNVEQTNIFSLFGIEDEYAEKKKREEQERLEKQAEAAKQAEELKKKSGSSSSTKSSSAGDTFEINDQTTIYFYTEVISVTDYFTLEELTNGLAKKNKETGEKEFRKIKENDLKNRLKKDYPVLETGAQLVYIKKKNVVSVILQAKKKGLSVNDESKESHTGPLLSFHKIPFNILREFISISKYYSDEYSTEFHADIYFDLDTQEFFMDIPKQTVHHLWVEVTEDPIDTALKTLEKRCVKCMEIHSHHQMSPSPSLQDDESERAPILYAIVGRLDKFFPEITVRTFNIESGLHIKLNPWSIFENPFSIMDTQHDLHVVEVV